MVSYRETSMALMHDYVIRANFTTTPRLKEKFFAYAFIVLGYSIQLYCLGNLFGSFYLSGKLPTYPSPKTTLILTSHLMQNFGLGEGWVGSFPEG